MTEIEILHIDRRWEALRLPDQQQERRLLSSIAEGGIREPLQGVMLGTELLLLDGFKRLRCCHKLGLRIAPMVSLGEDEAAGILMLLRQAISPALTILEQAALVDELKDRCRLSVAEIARRLERSPAWVSVRVGLLARMSPSVREEIFSGRFPARAYLYTLRTFTRVNKIPHSEIDDFVKAVSGQQMSLRQIDVLAQGYFRGSEAFKTQIRQGQISWTLEQLQKRGEEDPGLGEREKRILLNLEQAQKCMHRLQEEIKGADMAGNDFFVQAELLAEEILRMLPLFARTLEALRDTCR